ncbi:MAG: uroporphyrinogen decarboxylase [Gammaproteobacteria bacterium AqS3]|nr:uroporphyrinogen decarboxylase [Gammaproteobacteria bacterium AqS3]
MSPGTPPLLLRALACEPVERVPVWVMRQAGRYLPEYRELRSQVDDFMDLVRRPELCCTLALQPIRRYDLDAAILFSDILTVPDALGCGVHFVAGEGPRLRRRIEDGASLARLDAFDPARLDYVYEAVERIRSALPDSVALIGFSGSPWTLAAYMVEGGGSSDFARLRALLYQQPDTLRELTGILAGAVREYLLAQRDAGAQALQLFDTWGGLLPGHLWRELSLRPACEAVRGLDVPVILFTKGGGLWLEDMRDAGFGALGIDWTCDLADARRRLGEGVALQGNLDPLALRAAPGLLREEVGRILDAHPGPGHIFNLGHGITPATDPEALAVVVDAVRSRAVT